jgi:hypothetical protein
MIDMSVVATIGFTTVAALAIFVLFLMMRKKR